MSIFLVAIPKLSERLGSVEAVTSRTAGVLRRVREGYETTLGPIYADSPKIRHVASNGFASTLAWHATGTPERTLVDGSSWSVHAGTYLADGLHRSLTRRGGRLVYQAPLWGQYAAVLGDRYANRVTAWNTTPALDAIHYGESGSFVFISNRPLLVALALAAGDRHEVTLSPDYLVEYLAYGYSITHQSPFQGVSVLGVNSAVSVRNGEINLVEVPPGLTSSLSIDHTGEEAAESLAVALRHATERLYRTLPTTQPLLVRTSGGKDSRLLLGLLKDGERSVQAVTFGREVDLEVRIARALTSLAGVEHIVDTPQLAQGETLAEQVASTIRNSDGMPPSEPHTAMYQGSAPTSIGQGIALGQWPLMKGGLAKRLRYTALQAENAVLGQASAIVSAAARALYDEYLRNWYKNAEADNPLERLYLFSREFRSGRWLQAHIALFSRDAQICYPISDSEVTSVSDALTVGERVSQRTYYGAIERIWPAALELPLEGQGWPFQSHQHNQELLSRFTPPTAGVSVDDSGPKATEYSVSTARAMALELQKMEHFEYICQLLNDDFTIALMELARGNFDLPLGFSKRAYIKQVWRVYVAAVWLNRGWL